MSYPVPPNPAENPDLSPERMGYGAPRQQPEVRHRLRYDPERHPCMEHLGRMATALQNLGVTRDEFAVASITEIRDRSSQGAEYSVALPNALPIPLRGWGGHSAFREGEEGAARRLLLEMVKTKEPGTAKVTLFNGTATETFKDFSTSLGPVITQASPNAQGLKQMLNDIWEFQSSLATNQHELGTAVTPRRIAVIVGNGEDLPRESQQLLNRILAADTDAVSVVMVNVPFTHDRLQQSWPEPRSLVVKQHNPSSEEVNQVCSSIAETARSGQEPPLLEDVLPLPAPSELMSETAVYGLKVPLGIGPDGKVQEVELVEMDSHALVLAATGAGKTTLTRAMYTALGTKYGPDEVELYLLDGKSAEFAGHAPSNRHEDWEIHTRVLGTNINKDPEFASAVITRIEEEMERRSRLFIEHDVTNYTSMRLANPDIKLPRIVVGADEFQVFLMGSYGDEMAKRLEDIARRGRGLGVHMILATQDVRGIQSLWAGTGKVLFGQMGLKIAGRGGSLLEENNVNTVPRLPKMQMVVQSAEKGTRTLVRVAGAFEQVARPYRRAVWEEANRRGYKIKPPRVFDGGNVPKLQDDPTFKSLRKGQDRVPEAIIAQDTSVDVKAATVRFDKQDGRNLAVIGPRTGEANRILDTAGRSLARQMTKEEAKFTLVCLDEGAKDAAEKTKQRIMAEGHDDNVRIVTAKEAPLFLAGLSHDIGRAGDGDDERRHFLMVYGASSGGKRMAMKLPIALDTGTYDLPKKTGTVKAGSVIGVAKDGSGKQLIAPANGTLTSEGDKIILELSKTGREHLASIAEFGPEEGVHVLASWPSARVMKESLPTNSPHDFGAFVALGVPESEVAHMTPGVTSRADAAAATPENRGKFFDRARAGKYKRPRVVVPYATDRTPES